MPGVWQTLHSWFTRTFARENSHRTVLPPRVPVVALVVSEEDRGVLTGVSVREPMDIHFVESWEEACAAADRLAAPVILFDRDWPGTEWRVIVQSLARSGHRACVVLISGVSDDYLWQELIRRGGYDVLSKPLRADNVTRVIKLALSYWNSAPKSTVTAQRLRK